ncbi:MAG: mevalonate kinase [Saprospiraceae bacterium]|nr:mevalonate kinase [Saprospiraceae bacterium]MDW8483122.1 mevalonate kinase [Saprospiraceae bacterium]
MRYPAKVLLFGEYVVLVGARALSLPFERFGGEWAWSISSSSNFLRETLREFARSRVLQQIPEIDVAAFQQDVTKGLVFFSDIPMGYGLGSSGALCAAVYDRYASSKATELTALQRVFAQMESYFHGKSSGLDPLTSYTRRPILVQHGQPHFFEQRPWQLPPPQVFLLDTGQARQTGPFVQEFLEKCRQQAFSAQIERELLPAHEALIDAWLAGRGEDIWPNLGVVSAFQWKHFQPMIPSRWRQPWAQALENGEVLFKLCGAGGGGFLLIFGKEHSQVQKRAQNAPLIPVLTL